jgi:hypothetical protein
MIHYWTTTAIMNRLGIGSRKTLYDWIMRKGLPVFKRRPRGRAHDVVYSNERLILGWEMAQARAYRESLRGGKPSPPINPSALHALDLLITPPGENGTSAL